ncbi:hypothetical protein Slin14017_G107520 [Septoria linicola]|nr:hypothetical protein Slin14017_G107520 [Septoria linicola]
MTLGGRHWSQEDLELVRKLKHDGTPVQEWAPLFPGRPYRSLEYLKHKDLNPATIVSARRQWTAAEKETVLELKARNADPKELLQALPGRSLAAITNQPVGAIWSS